jgi:hypothetical protein
MYQSVVTGIAGACVGARNPGNDAGEKVQTRGSGYHSIVYFFCFVVVGLLSGSGCLVLGAGWGFRLII